jgi:hypothetical protein
MFITIIILSLITFGGAALTYLFAEDQTFLWRFSAGNIVGSAIFGIVGFLLACLIGLSNATVYIALLITLLPLLLYKKDSVQKRFRYDRQMAKSRFQGTSFKKFFRFLYYVSIFIMLWLFFERAMLVNENGIFTGASQNLGDLPFHLGAIFSFTDGQNFPPQNPSYADAKFTYPFIADLITAFLVKVGASVENAMLVQNVFFGFSLVVIFEKFVFKLTNNKLAGKIAPLILLFSGGLGFLWFAKDLWEGGKGFFDFLWNLPRDYTISEKFRWGNSLIVLFITQRSLVFGMPLTLIVLTKIWEIFQSEKEIGRDKTNFFTFSPFHFSTFLVGLLAGTLPLIHAHSLFVLFVVTACLFFFRPDKWREWISFGIGTAIVALPILLWITTGSATHLSEFIAWHFGWDSREDNFLWFWLKNTGMFIPLLIAGIVWKILNRKDSETQSEENKKSKNKKQRIADNEQWTEKETFEISPLLYFYVPFFLLFIVSNTIKLAPWEWDNIKVLIYWFVGSIPFVAWLIAKLWVKSVLFKIAAIGCLTVLIFAGGLDVWRVISGAINYNVFSKDAVETARLIKIKTAPNALFLNAPTYNSAVVLTGRRSLMRYGGHLASHGIDYTERQEDLRRIYAGEGSTDILLRKYGIEYVLISPEVRSYATDPSRPFVINEEFFKKFPVVAEVGQFKVYKVK